MKKLMWVLVLAAAAYIGYRILYAKPVPVLPVNEEQPSVSAEKKMAFNVFLQNDKGSYRCTVDQYLSDMDSNGVVYVNAGIIRGDFTTVAEGKLIATSFLIKDGYQYLWSSAMQKSGVKMRVADGDTGSTQADAVGAYSWNAEQIGDYDCQPWKADTATFALPSGVVFTDVSTMMKAQ